MVEIPTREFNGSVNIPETCDFRSQFDRLNIIVYSFSETHFAGIYVLNEKYGANKFVSC